MRRRRRDATRSTSPPETGAVVVPAYVFSQIEWADKYVIPYGGPANGGFYGGDGDQAYPGDWYERMRITKSGEIGIGTESP